MEIISVKLDSSDSTKMIIDTQNKDFNNNTYTVRMVLSSTRKEDWEYIKSNTELSKYITLWEDLGFKEPE